MAIRPVPVQAHQPTRHRQLSTRVIRNVSQSIPNDASTYLIWEAQAQDDEGLWAPGNPTLLDFSVARVPPLTTGLFVITARIAFAASAVGYRSAWFEDPTGGAITAAERFAASPTTQTILTIATVIDLADTLDTRSLGVRVRHTAGAALNVEALETTETETSLTARRLTA